MPRPCIIPSIMQVLERGYDHQGWCEEGCSTVIIRSEPPRFHPSQTKDRVHNVPPNQQAHLMKTIDLRHVDLVQSTEHFSYIVCFPNKESQDAFDQDESDTSTIFEGKRPKTSRGYPKYSKPRRDLSRGQEKFWSLAIAAQKLLPPKRTGSILFKRQQC